MVATEALQGLVRSRLLEVAEEEKPLPSATASRPGLNTTSSLGKIYKGEAEEDVLQQLDRRPKSVNVKMCYDHMVETKLKA